MGKKKLSLKPVNRGFATTSVQSRKAKQDASTKADTQNGNSNAPQNDTPTRENQPVKSAGQDGQPPSDAAATPAMTIADDWDSEQAIDDALYQGLVERLQEKADKEVTRLVKSLDQEKRFAASFPPLRINDNVRDQVVQYAKEDLCGEGSAVKPWAPATSVVDSDKILLRTYVTFQVLSRLGFSDTRIEECILQGLSDGQGWAEGEEWMWLNLSEDECRGVGEFVSTNLSKPLMDEPLIDVAPEAPPLSSEAAPDNKFLTVTTPNRSESTSAPEGGSLFQSLEADQSDSSSESEDELNMNKTNESWAMLMLELENLKAAAGTVKGKGKKSKNQIAMETPEMVKIRNKTNRLEKEYMFSKKDADALLKVMRSKRDMKRLEAKLKNIRPPSTTNSVTPAETPPSTSALDSFVSDDGDEEGSLFGNMLDEPEGHVEVEQVANSVINVLSLPVPKQFALVGNTAKNLLRTTTSKSSRPAVISYARLSPNPRVARAGLEIRWSSEKRRVWRMEDIACESVEEAENYVSTLALHDLVVSGDLLPFNWRSMPPAYRDLWDELEQTHTGRELAAKREIWKKMKALVDKKTSGKIGAVGITTSKRTYISTSAVATRPSRPANQVYIDNLQKMYENRIAAPAYQKMRQVRDSLPIAPFRQQILETLERTQVLVFSGETGCGKSTQLPAFILEDQLSKGKPCKIFVTEPRRISAISLAQRVSVELGESPGAMGNASSLVGYSIRLEAKMSPSTRLAFVTNGIALRMLEGGSGSSFDEVTHIVVDEVHERSIESDFLLIVLKQLLEVRKDLKVVLMSATVDAEKISDFFGGCPAMQVPGRTFPVQVQYLEDAVEVAGWHIDESSPYAVWDRNRKTGAKKLEWTEEAAETAEDAEEDEDKPADPTKLSSSTYSARTVATVNLLDSRKIPYDLIVRLLERICFEDPNLQPFSAASLVFMPGLAEIRKLHEELQSHPHFGTREFAIYPLHSSISSEGQSSVFDLPPRGVRKIVISTNIAETGVTIPDITCVIDSGKQREMRYDEKRQLSRLVETYIARSNAKQRRGRAGRVQEGLAFHLFTKARHDNQLAEHPIPEMLRLSLQDLALRIKILKVKMGDTVEEVLMRALDPPSATNIQRAVSALVEVKALTPDEEITPMGRLLSKLPMDVHLGKFLLVAALFRCLDPALTIAATLNSKSPFITPFGFENQATAAKKSFSVGNNDFFTIVNVFDTWRRAHDNASFVRTFCKRNYVSHQNLQQIEELRQQLMAYLIDSSFVEVTPEQKQEIARARYSRGFKTRFVTVPPQLNENAANERILSAALASGLYPKILTLDAAGGLRTISNQQPVSIHPSSINFGLPKREFGSNNLVYYTLMQSKKLYAWETGPIDDRALALLCGDFVDTKLSASSMQIDRKLRFQVDPRSALALKHLRDQLASSMATRFRGRSLSDRQSQWFELALKCLATGVYEDQQTVVVS